MSDMVGTPKDRFSRVATHVKEIFLSGPTHVHSLFTNWWKSSLSAIRKSFLHVLNTHVVPAKWIREYGCRQPVTVIGRRQERDEPFCLLKSKRKNICL